MGFDWSLSSSAAVARVRRLQDWVRIWTDWTGGCQGPVKSEGRSDATDVGDASG